ncbi:hypothetical protein GNI_163580 [Gregarina niphandrodes]|uniref:Transmembrane protein n=1 Tax=Gregarina niphandrodes TaxID=110365 RepID=A0A023AYW2_GRENI|nr:hypothetical protein GNI_163580 [Gregarina niphandrodes]EZG43643.1 hypothetical protein GNI_163580 [Gregarina niphandrodes]|eukprot:XP_011133117.1 hypothetical protein GNI_163580 [Gregarina niphandrodes]
MRIGDSLLRVLALSSIVHSTESLADESLADESLADEVSLDSQLVFDSALDYALDSPVESAVDSVFDYLRGYGNNGRTTFGEPLFRGEGVSVRRISQWDRVLAEYSRGNVTLVARGVRHEMATVELLRTAIDCEGVVYTAHDSSREVDCLLDVLRAEWAQAKQHVCFFRLNIDVPVSVSGATVSQQVQQDWRRRTRNNPIVLTDRYKSGLLLIALIRKGVIKLPAGSVGKHPWIFYIDGDVGMTNVERTLRNLVTNVEQAARHLTMEERLLNRTIAQAPVSRAADAPERRVDMVFPHGDCLLPTSYSQTGTLLIRPTTLAAFVLETVANSPYHVLDTSRFAMGDQAVVDTLLTAMFGMRWTVHNNYCRNSKNFKPGCNLQELSYFRTIDKRLPAGPKSKCPAQLFDNNSKDMRGEEIQGLSEDCWNQFDALPALFRRHYRQWFLENEDVDEDQPWVGGLAFACPRWTNSPICEVRRARGPSSPFHFRCGDLLFHLYGCSKNYIFDPNFFDYITADPKCEQLMPPSAIAIFNKHREDTHGQASVGQASVGQASVGQASVGQASASGIEPVTAAYLTVNQ